MDPCCAFLVLCVNTRGQRLDQRRLTPKRVSMADQIQVTNVLSSRRLSHSLKLMQQLY